MTRWTDRPGTGMLRLTAAAAISAAAVFATAGCGSGSPHESSSPAANVPLTGSSTSSPSPSPAPASSGPAATSSLAPATADASPSASPSAITPPSAAPSSVGTVMTSTATTSVPPSQAPPPPSASAPASSAAAATRCHTGDLSASLRRANAAAGNLYGAIVLQNTSTSPCTVFGYGGMQLYRAGGTPVPTDMVRDPAVAPVTLTLAPEGRAYSMLHWSDVPGPGDAQTGSCQPIASTAHVTPPDETTFLTVTWLGSPVCEHGRITQGAYRAGSGPSS